MIKIDVFKDGHIIPYNNTVADSVLFEKIRFNFPKNWNGYTKTAVFRNGETTVSVVLDKSSELCTGENECYIPFAFEHGENGDLLIQKAPACTIETQAKAVCELFCGKTEDIKVIGIRHGEKMYETLLTNEECAKAVDMGDFYRVPADNRGLNYDKFFNKGDEKRNTLTEFNSHNTTMLSVEETKAKIASISYIQEELKKL